MNTRLTKETATFGAGFKMAMPLEVFLKGLRKMLGFKNRKTKGK